MTQVSQKINLSSQGARRQGFIQRHAIWQHAISQSWMDYLPLNMNNSWLYFSFAWQRVYCLHPANYQPWLCLMAKQGVVHLVSRVSFCHKRWRIQVFGLSIGNSTGYTHVSACLGWSRSSCPQWDVLVAVVPGLAPQLKRRPVKVNQRVWRVWCQTKQRKAHPRHDTPWGFTVLAR